MFHSPTHWAYTHSYYILLVSSPSSVPISFPPFPSCFSPSSLTPLPSHSCTFSFTCTSFYLITIPSSFFLTPSPLLFPLFFLLHSSSSSSPIDNRRQYLPPPPLTHFLPVTPLPLSYFSLSTSSFSFSLSSSALQWNKRLQADESLFSMMAAIHHWDCTRARPRGDKRQWDIRRRKGEWIEREAGDESRASL